MKRILTILSCVLVLLLCVTCQENNIFLGDVPSQPSDESKDTMAMLQSNMDCVADCVTDAVRYIEHGGTVVFYRELLDKLNGLDNVEYVSFEEHPDYSEYHIDYKDGTMSGLVFMNGDTSSSSVAACVTRSADVDYEHVPEENGEYIVPQEELKVMIWEPLSLWFTFSGDELTEAIDKSPVRFSQIERYRDLGALDHINDYDIVLLTKTHGVFSLPGGFGVDFNNDVNRGIIDKRIKNPYLFDYYAIEFLGKYGVWQCRAVAVQLEKFVGERKLKENSIFYGDYCWSFKNAEFNAGIACNNVGYTDKTTSNINAKRVNCYFFILLNGYTHEVAVGKSDDTFGGTSSNNKHPKLRFFSISTGEAEADNSDMNDYWVSGSINGYANLKKDVVYRVYYNDMEFSSPNSNTAFETVVPDEFGNVKAQLRNLKPGSGYYYCLAMEYGDEVYYGDVKSFKTEDKFVDLGLSVLWARCNVGANRPEESGGYYAWGEKTEKDSYNNDSYRYFKYREPDSVNWFGWYEVLKYCLDSDNGNVDGLKTLQESDDVAMDSSEKIRMPSKAEFEELVKQCVWERDSINGVWGYKVIGPNKNSIFLPASGKKEYTSLNYAVTRGIYWSNELDMEYVWPDTCPNSYSAYTLEFSTGWIKDRNDYVDYGKREEKCSSAGREYGCTVRAVKEKQQ